MKTLKIMFSVFSFAGATDAVYLTIRHFKNTIPACALNGCETVLTSQYAEIFNIPVALIGALFYLTAFSLILISWKTKNNEIIITLLILTALALLISLVFLYLQFFILKAVCEYCLVSEAISMILFAIAVSMARRTRFTPILS